MHKSKYLSAEQLSIAQEERKWLIKTVPFLAAMRPKAPKKIPSNGMFAFEMNHIVVNKYTAVGDSFCGTAGCIWGAAHLLALAKKQSPWGSFAVPDNTRRSEALRCLFYPHEYTSIDLDRVTPKCAARATDHFLKTGKVVFKVRRGGVATTYAASDNDGV